LYQGPPTGALEEGEVEVLLGLRRLDDIQNRDRDGLVEVLLLGALDAGAQEGHPELLDRRYDVEDLLDALRLGGECAEQPRLRQRHAGHTDGRALERRAPREQRARKSILFVHRSYSSFTLRSLRAVRSGRRCCR